MKRWVKNLICFGAIGLMLVVIALTISVGMSGGPGGQMGGPGASGSMENQQMGTPPELPGGNSQGGQQNQNGSEPPAKPDGESNSSGGQQNQNGSEPPAKPDGESNSSGGQQNQNGSEPPAKPEGEGNSQSGSGQMGTPPDVPNGNSQGGQPGGQMGGGSAQGMQQPGQPGGFDSSVLIYVFEIFIIALLVSFLILSRCNKRKFKESFKGSKRTVAFILFTILFSVVGSFGLYSLSASLDPGMGKGGEMQQSNNSAEYSATKTIDSNTTEEGEKYESTESDKLAVLVMKDITANLRNFVLNKSGSSDGGDNTSFYGTNSGITAKDGAKLNIEDAEVNTDASGANGIFSFGGSMQNDSSQNDGTKVTVKNSKITTKQNNSGGVMTTGGGLMDVINCIIETFGISSAPIRTDRGGGTVNVEGGTYTSNGQGSPAIYSTADVSVKNAELRSNVSEGVVIEGKNSVNLENCKVYDNNNKLNGQSTTYKNIFLYQSMSGDSSEGTSKFSAKDCNFETVNGDGIYVTNTKAEVTFENCENLSGDNNGGNLLRAQKDSWGSSGKNGGEVTFNLKNQKATGNIVIDAISSLVMNMTNNSYWEGALNSENQSQNIILKLDSSSKIKLSADSYVKSLEDTDSSYSNIDFNGHKLYVNGTAIN